MTYQFTCTCGAWLETDALGRVACERCGRRYVVEEHQTARPVARVAWDQTLQIEAVKA